MKVQLLSSYKIFLKISDYVLYKIRYKYIIFFKKIDKIFLDARVQEKLPSHRGPHSQQREAVTFYSCLQ